MRTNSYTYNMVFDFLQETIRLKSAVSFNNRNMFKSSGISIEWNVACEGQLGVQLDVDSFVCCGKYSEKC